MYNIEPYKPRIRLIGNDGTVVEYLCWDEFLDSVDYWFIDSRVVDQFNDPRDKITMSWYLEDLRRGLPGRVHYVVRDEFDKSFKRDEILEAISARNREKKFIKLAWLYKKYDFVYRQTPVPYTGKRRWKFKHFYRRPKTTQEKRLSYAYTGYVRGGRKPKSLPDAWEDIPRSRTKNWKKQRRTQYK